MSKTYRRLASAAVIVVSATLAAAAHADTTPPYFSLIATNSSIPDIGAEVGFNPQPDPPGSPATILNLGDAARPTFINTSTGGAFTLVFAFEGLGTDVIPLPAPPNSDGRTGFEQTIDGHVLDVGFGFTGGGGPVLPGSWVSFNPQPDPPGDVLGLQFQFAGREDPQFFFTATLDGNPLTFGAAPEPASWALMIVGFGGVGAIVRRRKAMPAQPI